MVNPLAMRSVARRAIGKRGTGFASADCVNLSAESRANYQWRMILSANRGPLCRIMR